MKAVPATVAPDADGSSAPSVGRLVGLTLAFSLLLALLAVAPAFAAPAPAPVVTIEAPTEINKTTAHFRGTVNPEGRLQSYTCWFFEIVRKAKLEAGEEDWHTVASGCFGEEQTEKSEPIPVSSDISGLRGSSVYLVRLHAFTDNNYGIGERVFGTSAEEEFETLSVIQPVATIEAPTGIGYSSAHVSGHVNPEAGPGTTCWSFEIVRKAKLEAHEEGWNVASSECFSEEDSAKTEPLPVSAELSGLGSTVYLVRLSASNAEGDGVSTREEFETEAVTPPSVTIKPVTGISGFSATFAGTVNPNAPEPAPTTADVEGGFHTSWHFECEPQCQVGGGELAADDTASEVEQEAVLKPNKTYVVKLVASNNGGSTIAETTFETPKVGPTVAYLPLAPVSMVTDEEARLGGRVDPRESGALTDCHFEYGPTSAYGSSVPCELNGEDTYVSAHLTGLQPNTTYHFRIVAANTVETVVGGDQQFKTFATPPAGPACPNEEARKEQKATMLPECRAWEMVSPVDKNGGNIDFESWSVYTADDGGAVSFRSRGSFAGTRGSGSLGQTMYIARRGTSGWETHSLYPVSDQKARAELFAVTLVGQFSEDLSHGILTAWDLPEVSDDLKNSSNDYWEDTRTGQLTTITKSFAQTPSAFEFTAILGRDIAVFGSASADQHVISFKAETPLLPEAPEGVESIYEWEEGNLRLASIFPDGSIDTAGASSPSFGLYRGGGVSPDGSLVTFYAAQEGYEQLYVRRNHSDTAWVSEPEGSAPISVAENVHLQYISPDSRHILFTTTSQLVDEDTNESNDLYMWTNGPNPASEDNLTLISGNGAEISEGVIGTSRDASYIYYLAQPEGVRQIVLWKNGTRRVVADAGGSAMTIHESPGTARVSASGKILAFITDEGGERGLTGNISHGHKELYVYNDDSETLTCASCAQTLPVPEEGEPEAEGDPETHHGVIVEMGFEVPEYERPIASGTPGQPRYLSADGKHVFFSTGEGLVPEDKNEAVDVYEYNVETGQQRLLSSGRGEAAALFAGASTDGREVAFITHQALVGRDFDTLADVYMARVNGGFVEPPPPPTSCVGDGCRGPIPAAPEDTSPATPRFSGPGNPPPVHHKHHHHKKKHKKHHKKHHRGGGK